MVGTDIRRYQNRTIEAAQVIAELIELAKQMRKGQKRNDSSTAGFRPFYH
jgi:type I restriction enzyme R subunit